MGDGAGIGGGPLKAMSLETIRRAKQLLRACAAAMPAPIDYELWKAQAVLSENGLLMKGIEDRVNGREAERIALLEKYAHV